MLELAPAELDFGTVAQAGKGEMTFWLHNPTMVAVEIKRVETSCPCFNVELREKVVQPGKKVAATARVDFKAEPHFVGGLRLEATGYAKAKGSRAFRVHGTVTVASTKTGTGG